MSELDGDDAAASELEKDFVTLDHWSRARLNFELRLCEASASQDEKVLDALRQEKMFELAQFYFTLLATGLNGPEDAALLADLHNDRIDRLLRDKEAIKRRGLREERLLWAIFTGDTRPRLEMFWRDRPGALDQSNLARLLVTQMSPETVRKLVEACEAAGFIERISHPAGATIVVSKGIVERVLSSCLKDLRTAIW